MTIHLHVGFPKCASTWLQHLVLPASGLPFGTPTWKPVAGSDPDLDAVAQLVSTDEPLGARSRGLLRRLVGREGAVISSESALAGPWRVPGLLPVGARVERLLDLTEGSTDVAALVVSRQDPEEHLRSLYGQYIRNGGSRPLARFRRHVANPELSDPMAAIDHLRRAVPATTVLHLEQLQQDPEGFVRDIAAWLGVALDPTLGHRVRNRGWSSRRLGVLRVANHLAPTFGERGLVPERCRSARAVADRVRVAARGVLAR